MNKYKIVIQPVSSFSSELQSDTFFGAFCWSYKYLYGTDALEELLYESYNNVPQIILSNAFPSGYLPCPLGVKDSARTHSNSIDKAQRKRIYQEDKRIKKCDLISLDGFKKIQRGDVSGFTEDLEKSKSAKHSVTHNLVSRDAGTVTELANEAGLYSTVQYFAGKDDKYDLYIFTMLSEKVLKDVLELMFMLGIGADKSAGQGAFKIDGNIESCEDLFKVTGANSFMALSNFIPANEDSTDGAYQTFVKFGKLDREFAESGTPFKKPLLYIKAGAIFKTEDVKEYYGRLLKGVAVNPDIVVNACTIAVPMVYKP